MNILHIDSSINGDSSVSRVVSQSVVDRIKELHPDSQVVRRDLGRDPLAHFTLEAFGDTKVIDEFLASDIIVLGAPMYNFGVPSQLKAWLDRIAIAGKTFRYTENGPVGLAGGRKLIVASSRGGFYGPDTPIASLDHQESYLRAFFHFLGVTDIHFIHTEGVAMGPDARQLAIEAALGQVQKLAA